MAEAQKGEDVISIRGSTFTCDVTFVVEECCNCGIQFAITSDFKRRMQNSHAWFYCPVGHSQRYTAETDAEKARRERDIAKQQLARAEDEKREAVAAAEARARAAEAKTKRVTKRAHAGLCQCCNRTFSNVVQHMADMHPEIAVLKIPKTKKPKKAA